MSKLVCYAFLLVLPLVLGCGEPVSKVEKPAPTTMIEAVLNDIAMRGELDSGAEELRQQLEDLRQTDPDKAELLLGDYNQSARMNYESVLRT
jgi:DNA integrity scanning protein DisA with diadenylate cyclase activity